MLSRLQDLYNKLDVVKEVNKWLGKFGTALDFTEYFDIMAKFLDGDVTGGDLIDLLEIIIEKVLDKVTGFLSFAFSFGIDWLKDQQWYKDLKVEGGKWLDIKIPILQSF